ncbi:MAG: hypothetical protein Q4A70_00645 [Candidatus Saccharibacteria bacterium]|nr:hypothetical protein [Candidatus Saccharibacteria bacterium]
MNKDVLYIEPEDDITDIITKIEKSKEKIIALVPPKKAGVFRSVVNIKLINKAGKSAEKTIVLVTTDPSIVKLAAATKLPVTKDLQTAPVIPKEEKEEEDDTVSKEELVEESDGTVETVEDVEELEGGDKEDEESADEKSEKTEEKDEKAEDADEEEDEEDEKEPEAKNEKAKIAKEKPAKKRGELKPGNKIIAWLTEHKKIAIISGVGAVVLILLLVWALALAPSATVTVSIRTDSNNFSQAVSFVEKINEEDADAGKFYLEEKKVESTETVEFAATGKKNVGEKAKGEVVIYAFFKEKGAVQVSAGATFTLGDYSFTSDKAATLNWDGMTATDCENNGQASAITSGCLIYGRVDVTAVEPGSKYNIAESNTGWNTTAPVGVYSDKAMSGGTDKEITVVQQSDIDKAKESLKGANLEENKEKLLEQIGDNVMLIDSSLKQETLSAEATPKVDEEVKEGVKPTLKATTVTSVFVIDKTKVEEFITKKANLGEDKKIYEMNNPFIESFTKTEAGYTGKLKTSYMTGPKLTVSSIVDLIKGRGFGDAQHVLKDIDGVTEVKINGSFPWVTSIPGDSNKITVNLEIKDQSGNKVEQKEDEQSADEKSEKKDEKSEKTEEKQ